MNSPAKLFFRIIACSIIALTLVTLFVLMVKDVMPKDEIQQIENYSAWSPETLEVIDKLPLQDGGRIKPFSSYAAFTMLQLYGERSIKLKDAKGVKINIKPTAWLMDCLFRPALAAEIPTFRVDNPAVITALGLESQSRRLRYTYKQIESKIPRLFELAQGYEKIEAKTRDATQNGTVDLAYNVRSFQVFIGYFSFARSGIQMMGAGENGENAVTRLSTVMATTPMIQDILEKNRDSGEQVPDNLTILLSQVIESANFAKYGLILLPPDEEKILEWRSLGDRIMDVMQGNYSEPDRAIAEIKSWEDLVTVVDDEKAFRSALIPLVSSKVTRATELKSYHGITAEVTYNKKQLPLHAMVCFLIGVVSASLMWLLQSLGVKQGLTPALHILTLLCSLGGLGYMGAALAMRSYIMWRPPIGNLYDTIIFICFAVVAVLLIVEWFSRLRVASTLSVVGGLALVILARRFEVGDAKDHMDPLVAVLKSNYWLTTHVITVTFGYAAGLLTALLSAAYVILRGMGFGDKSRDFLKLLTKVAYGCLCLTLLLSLVGTVLGGIWANDSWGRFWGWDPKENGALMIVLWTLAILHARLGGLIREWGFHLASLFTACVVSFSWWHVNFLGVGLHNYGFASGKSSIWMFYGGIVGLIFFGIVMWIYEVAASKPSSTRLRADAEPSYGK
jgi:ABC-type transport system involved in cytochrome c biogenesis permease subunit